MSEETAGGGASKLDTLSKEELVKLVKKYIVLHKQLKTKNEELTNKLNETSSAGSTSPPITENNDSVVKELNEKIDSLRDENNRLNDKIKQLDAEIASLNLSRYEIEKSKEEMSTMLETSRREIDLNKSMLDMLNNEINHLNGEKLQLEKKLINARRNTTPSVIVEEEEEDLEEEERESKKLDEEKERQQDGGDSGAGSGVGGLDVASRSHSNGGTPHGSLLFLNKDIEDMTFYVDELKSELEAERERNNEFSNEIRALKKELDELKQQPQNKDSNEINNHIPKTTETESNNKIEENNQEVNGEHVSSVLGKLKELFENGWDKEELYNDQNGFGDSFREVSAVFRQKFSSYEKKLAEMKTKESYMEKQMEKIISDFKKEISDLESKLGEKENELNTLKTQNEAKLKALKSDLDSEREKSKTTQTKLEKFEKEAAKSKVLDLEIADYERSIKSLNVQIIAKEKDLTDARNEITQLSATVEKLRGDLERVETELSDEKEKSAKLKQLLVVAKKDLAEAKSHQAEQQSLDATSRHQIERLQIDLDAYKVQLVESGAERERLRDRVTALVEASQRDEEETEKRIADKQEEIDELKKRLKDLEVDYDAYKLKVQQAFKRQKEESNLASQNQVSQKLAAESQAELERLQASVKLLTGQLDASNDRAVKLERANEALRDEYTMCLERNTKLLADLKHKESQWETRLNEVSRLASLKQDEHDVALRRLEELSEQKQGELRERIKNIQAQHCQAIDFLQKQLVEARNETERLGKQVEELNKSLNNSKSTPNDDVISNLSSRSRNENFYKANPLLIKVDDNLENQPLSNNNNHSNGKSTPNSNSAQTPNGIISAKTIKSFEQLLNESNNNDENNDENEEASNSSKSPQSKMSSLMITQLKSDLSKTRVQIEHLNELLNESELNNARLSDQINLLKEEIRRLERNQEREKSISNMEYLKNVIMKFLTLSTVQERTQLIPVLSTMLRLSQEEQTAIINYSKAISSQQATGSSGSSWGTYFPKWS